MSHPRPSTLSIDRRILEHPHALHIRRIRSAVWLYLVLLTRQPADSDTFEIEPAKLAQTMGLSEGTIRSWLGHLRSSRYIEARKLNGTMRVRLKRTSVPEPPAAQAVPQRFFSVEKLSRALGESGYGRPLDEALAAHPDGVVQRALAGALAVPATEIRRSRTALFLYLLKRHAQQPNDNPRP